MIRKGSVWEESCGSPLKKLRGAGSCLPSRTGERLSSAGSKVRAKMCLTEGQMCVLPGTAKGISAIPGDLLLTSSTGRLSHAYVIPVLRESVIG